MRTGFFCVRRLRIVLFPKCFNENRAEDHIPVTEKPAYEDLERRIRELEEEAIQDKRVRESLRAIAGKYRLLTEKMMDIVWILDMNLRTVCVSPSIETVLGFTPEERTAQAIEEQLTPASLAVAADALAKELALEQQGNADLNRTVTIELEYYHKDGSTRWIENLVSGIRDEKGVVTGFHGVSRDITRRKKAEDDLRDSEKKYRELVDFLPISVFEIDLQGNIISGNPANFETFGYQQSDLEKGLNAFQMIVPEEHERLMANVQRLARREKKGPSEYTGIRKDGSTFPFMIFPAVIIRGGRPVGLRGAIIDLTERKQLEERLNRAEKMEALGTLAGGVAHDLNNVLGIMVGYSEFLLEKLPEESPLRKYAEKILRSSLKSGAIIQDLLSLARRGVTVSEVVDLNRVVSDYLRTPEFEKLKAYHLNVAIRSDIARGSLNVKGSPLHLGKVLMNLVSNAAEAISGPGTVTIRTESRRVDRPVRGCGDMREGDYAVLTVSDTGSGISPEDLGKIFEPFYTKKVMGRSGTGLGLTVVWGTVKDHNGCIDVQSEEGKGTAFTLHFPLTAEAPAKVEEPAVPAVYQGKGESILIVDDVEEQRELAGDMFGLLGYRIDAVCSGEAAVEYLKNKQADLVILDMIMDPGIDGMETYRRIREINPKQKTIIVSGFAETDRVKQTQALGAGAFVRKPYILEKIGLAVRQELDRR